MVLNELTGELPKAPINMQNIKLPNHIQLADPSFNLPKRIDIILGVNIKWDIVGTQQQSLGLNAPSLISSKLGWLVAGPIHVISSKYVERNQSALFASCKQESSRRV